MLVVWTISCEGKLAEIYEDGRVDSDDGDLKRRLQDHLKESVDVTRTGGGGQPLVLRPSDRRYVAARVRKLVAEDPGLRMVGIRISG